MEKSTKTSNWKGWALFKYDFKLVTFREVEISFRHQARTNNINQHFGDIPYYMKDTEYIHNTNHMCS